MLAETVQEWYARERAKGRRDGLAEGRAQGRAEGRAELMRRLAAIPDPERLAGVGEWLLECEDGDEPLQRVERLCGTSAAGDDLSPG